jgi:hypothetical protein
MIKEFEFYHGTVFSQIFHSLDRNISIRPYNKSDNASYVINNNTGIYIKYSTKRLTPWRFSFLKRHQDEILEMKNNLTEIFLLLVCNNDGIVILSFNDLKRILNETHQEIEWVSVSRNKRQMYTVCGSDGDLKFKISQNDFPSKIFNWLNTPPSPPLSQTYHPIDTSVLH